MLDGAAGDYRVTYDELIEEIKVRAAFHWNGDKDDKITSKVLHAAAAAIKDFIAREDDVQRLTRELDVAMHGEEGAAKQASLCDLVGPAARLKQRVETAKEWAEE